MKFDIKSSYFVPRYDSHLLRLYRTNGRKINSSTSDMHQENGIFIINTNTCKSERLFSGLMCCFPSSNTNSDTMSEVFHLGFVLYIDIRSYKVKIAVSKVPFLLLRNATRENINNRSKFSVYFDELLLDIPSLLNKKNLFYLNFVHDKSKMSLRPKIFSELKPDIINDSDGCFTVSTISPDSIHVPHTIDVMNDHIKNPNKSKGHQSTSLFCRNDFNIMINKSKFRSVKKRKRIRSGNRIFHQQKQTQSRYQKYTASAFRKTIYVTHTEEKDFVASCSFEDKPSVTFEEYLSHEKKEKLFAVPFLTESQGIFGVLKWDTFQDELLTFNGKLTPKKHDEKLKENASYFIRYKTINLDEYKQCGVKFRVMRKDELDWVMNIPSLNFEEIKTDFGSLFSIEESEFVHDPFFREKSDECYPNLHNNFPGVVVSQWLFCQNLNTVDVDFKLPELLNHTFGKDGFGSRKRSHTRGFNLYVGRRGSNQCSTSSFEDEETVRGSQYYRQDYVPFFTPYIDKFSDRLSTAAVSFPKSCDYIIDKVVSPKKEEKNSREYHILRGCRVKIITCGNGTIIGFCCSIHLDNRDVIFTSMEDINKKLNEMKLTGEDKRLFQSYLQKFIFYYKKVGVPTTCVYQFLGSEVGKNAFLSVKFHVYFLLDDFMVAMKLHSHVAHTFHAYAFYHRTAVPCLVLDGLVYYQHEHFNIFAWGGSGV